MDLNFFLESLKHTRNIEYCLNNMLSISDDFLCLLDRHSIDKHTDVSYFTNLRLFCVSTLHKLVLDKQQYYNNIDNNKLCDHVFIKDLIDTDVEKTQVIEYCSECGFTK